MPRQATAPLFATDEGTQPIVLDTTKLLVRDRPSKPLAHPRLIRLVRLRPV